MKQDPTVMKSKKVFHAFLISINQMMFEAGTAEMLLILRSIVGIKDPETKKLSKIYNDYQHESDTVNDLWNVFPNNNKLFINFRKHIEMILKNDRSEVKKLDKLYIQLSKANIKYLNSL